MLTNVSFPSSALPEGLLLRKPSSKFFCILMARLRFSSVLTRSSSRLAMVLPSSHVSSSHSSGMAAISCAYMAKNAHI